RVSNFTWQVVRQATPLLIAGAADRFLAEQFVSDVGSPQSPVVLGIFTILFLLLYTATLTVETSIAPDAGALFFRENLGAVSLALLAPMPPVMLRTLQIDDEVSLMRVIGGVFVVLTLWFYQSSWRLLHQEDNLRRLERELEEIRQQLENQQHQSTLLAAKAEVAGRQAQSLLTRARQFDRLAQLNETLRAFAGSALPYDSIIYQISETTGAHIAQLGLLSSSGKSLQYVAGVGLPAESPAIVSPEAGTVGRTLRLGQAVRVGYLPAEPDYVEQLPGMHSELCVPLMQGDRRLGVIRLLHAQPNAFTAEDEAFTVQAAHLVALALTNAALKEQAKTRQKEHAILFEAGSQLTANLDLRTVQNLIVQKLAEALDADKCTLAEVDQAALTFQMIEPYVPQTQAVADYPAMQQAIAERCPVSVQVGDSRADARELEVLRTEQMSTVLLAPMVVGTQVIGLARLYSREPRPYTPGDLQLIQNLANQAGVALQNAKSFQQVIESRDRLVAILNSTREGVLVIDSSGLISLANPRIEEFWGIPVTRLLHQPLTTLLADKELDIAGKLGFAETELEELLLTLRAGLALSIPKVQYRVQAQKTRYLERTGAPVLDRFSRAIGWVLILRDMTEERELQQVRDTLSNMIVHDLRSPLNSMLAGLYLIRDRLAPEQQTPLIRQSLEVAIRSCNKMIGLVSTLLDISRMESGELEIRRRPVQFSALVDEVLTDLMPLANDQGLVLINEVPPALPMVQGDPDKLSRVLTNLIDNALKFSPPGGQVQVRAEVLVTTDGAATNDPMKPSILCTVLDNGPGIPAEYRDRIFDRFVQVQALKGRREGTGLGLAFCKMAVEAHGGRIWAENRPEGGSAFCFTLPLEPGTTP
ncbi:MAG: GAF domain-containing protein, partial [Anaerolineales bacterium]|nr:GAF domain-containing protein [Anaerolineales bacterium]